MTLTPADIAAKITEPGRMTRPTFDASGQPSDWRPITTLAVFWQESRGDTLAVGRRIQVTIAGVKYWTCAFGWCQLLAAYHVDRGPFPDVPRMTVSECFDIDASWNRAWLLMNRQRPGWNYNLTWWSAFLPGPNGEEPAYKAHVPLAYDTFRNLS